MAQSIIDLVNNGGGVLTGLVPQTLAATAQGSSLDCSNLTDPLNAVVSVGAYGAGNTSLVVQIEESSTGTGSWTAIPGMVGTAVTTSNQTQVLRGLRTQRYVRANAVTVAGTTPSVAASVVIIGQGKFCPQNASGSDNYPST